MRYHESLKYSEAAKSTKIFRPEQEYKYKSSDGIKYKIKLTHQLTRISKKKNNRKKYQYLVSPQTYSKVQSDNLKQIPSSFLGQGGFGSVEGASGLFDVEKQKIDELLSEKKCDFAYIRYGNDLLYYNKNKEACEKISLQEKDLEQFDKHFEASTIITLLTLDQLSDIAFLTQHQPKLPFAIKIQDIKENENFTKSEIIASHKQEFFFTQQIHPKTKKLTITKNLQAEPIRSYMVMPQLAGVDLSEILSERWQKQHPTQYLHVKNNVHILFMNLLIACKKNNDAGIFHRDIKPQNIKISLNTLEVEALDFGLAREKSDTENEDCKGTLFYASPELLNNLHLDAQNKSLKSLNAKSDVYSLSLIFREFFEETNLIEQRKKYHKLQKHNATPIEQLNYLNNARANEEFNQFNLNDQQKFYGLISSMSAIFPENRPSFKNALLQLGAILKNKIKKNMRVKSQSLELL